MSKFEKQSYSVWVGGIEVNDSLLSLKEANTLADVYKQKGYTDVKIDNYDRIKQEN